MAARRPKSKHRVSAVTVFEVFRREARARGWIVKNGPGSLIHYLSGTGLPATGVEVPNSAVLLRCRAEGNVSKGVKAYCEELAEAQTDKNPAEEGDGNGE